MKQFLLTFAWLMVTVTIAEESSNYQEVKAARRILTSNSRTLSKKSSQSGYNSYVDVSWDRDVFKLHFRERTGDRFRINRTPKSTLGEPWPLPQKYTAKGDIVYNIDNNKFEIMKLGKSCDILEKAIERYNDIIFTFAMEEVHENYDHLVASPVSSSELYLNAKEITTLKISIKNPCDKYPGEKSKEDYALNVSDSGVTLIATEVWGAIRGLETFSQLVYKYDGKFYIRELTIEDFPRFQYRGLMADTARHYWPKELIYSMLDAMVMNKMNVFHWHIVDDQSFPYQSEAFPELSGKGAYHPSMVYTPADIADIVEYARLRAIRVIPEFDIPGHSFSWGLGKPDLMAQCYSDTGPIPGHYLNLDPSRNNTYATLETLFKEVTSLFPDSVVHTGGDEVPMDCWRTNPGIQKFVHTLDQQWSTQEIGKPRTSKAWNYFVHRVATMVKKIGEKKGTPKRVMMWNEVFKAGLKIPKDTIIHVWFETNTAEKIIESGYNVVYSECWYLDKVQEHINWPDHYLCDPNAHTPGHEQRESMILGGEACLWTENIASESAMFYAWPRASVVAERLWSHRDVRDVHKAATRLQEQRCRMKRRGLQVGMINGPDYCPPAEETINPKVKVADTMKPMTKVADNKINKSVYDIHMLKDEIKNAFPVSMMDNRNQKARLKAQEETVLTIFLLLPFLLFTLMLCFIKIRRYKILGRFKHYCNR
ncbi:beta-hexosaminidase subunit beta-like [Argopecten irradians]|uniref:beta-hexosaminidase subunit beta-like n=1 Tax=Argopecten irradians TaxID=31199 RepID=UPI003715AC86